MTDSPMTLAQRMKLAREYANLSQVQLSRCTSVTQQMISKLELGEAESSADIVKLAIAMKVRPEWLAEGKGLMLISYPYISTPPLIIEEPTLKQITWNKLFEGLTTKQQDELIRRASDFEHNNQEVIDSLTRQP